VQVTRARCARINDEVVSDEQRALTLADLNRDGVIKLSAGRKRHALVKVVYGSFRVVAVLGWR
jgi:tyrosyl-tRNA synthetase